LRECQRSDTYSGHYIGYPYIISAIARITEYRPTISNELSVAAACISVLLILAIAGSIKRYDHMLPIAAGLVFAATPVFAVNGVGSYAEPVSGCCVAGVLFLYLRCIYGEYRDSFNTFLAWSGLLLCLGLAILIKRENAVLAIVLPFTSGLRVLWGGNDRPNVTRVFLAFLVLAASATLALCTIGIGRTIVSETAEYGQFPFSVAGALETLPGFVAAFSRFSWYSGGLIFVLVGAAVSLQRRDRALYVLLVWLAYLGLYVSHVRHYYQVQGAGVSADETLRYSMNTMVCWSITAGYGIAVLIGFINRRIPSESQTWARAVGMSVALVWLGISHFSARELRSALVEDESESRILPALIASRFARDLGTTSTFIITPEPLVLQMYAEPSVNVVDLNAVEPALVSEITNQGAGPINWLYLRQNRMGAGLDRERYRDQLAYLDGRQGTVLYEGRTWSLVRLR
jgi:hypothetical protein